MEKRGKIFDENYVNYFYNYLKDLGVSDPLEMCMMVVHSSTTLRKLLDRKIYSEIKILTENGLDCYNYNKDQALNKIEKLLEARQIVVRNQKTLDYNIKTLL